MVYIYKEYRPRIFNKKNKNHRKKYMMSSSLQRFGSFGKRRLPVTAYIQQLQGRSARFQSKRTNLRTYTSSSVWLNRHHRSQLLPKNIRCLSTTSIDVNINPGLFSLPNLRAPQDFFTLANEAISTCNTLRETIRINLETNELTPRQTLHLLDDISNTVCSVIDASELCRSVHTSTQWRNAASSAFQILSEYIAELNADVNLYHSLVPITSNAQIMQSLTEEERRMAFMLQKEFERDAIHLSDKDRQKVQQLNGFVVQLESMFTDNLLHEKTFNIGGPLTEDLFRTIPKHVIEGRIPQENTGFLDANSVTLSTEPQVANSILRYSPSANLRKEVYMEVNTACPQNLEVLDALIQQRHALAIEMGYPSYAQYFLSDKMAQTPQVVMKFLDHVKRASQDRYRRDLEMLSKAKSQVEETSEVLQPWDMTFYTGMIKSQVFEGQGDVGESSMAGFFTVENSVEGMKILVQRLFGIEMKEVEMAAEERWDIDDGDGTRPKSNTSSIGATGVRRFEFYQECDGKPLGTMYLDLHPRPGKYSHAAHFTVRCGCESRDEKGEAEEAEYQLPIIALVCNLSAPASNMGSHAILSHSEVETLFHEFGHALHSLLSRTSFQHLSGTRVAMDFVETPSHLMEMYVWNEEFLNIIGSHYQTGGSIPPKNIENLVKSRNAFKAMEVQSQHVYALFDQTIFGDPQKWAHHSTTDIFSSLHKDNGLLFADGTHWHSKFGHLVSYGAGYYSYLYASTFSADIWSTCFAGGSDAFSREAGDKYWNEILINGGSKDPNRMLNAMLGREPKVDSFFQSLG